MRNSKSQLAIVTAVALIGLQPAWSKTNVAEKVEQLKENKEASKVNLDQYEENLKTVNYNLKENQVALKNLEKQKQALAKQTAETNKSKQSVDQVKMQLDGYMKTEQAKLELERKQIEELKQTLAQLEGNVIKREQNIAQYREKRQKVDTELGSWSERNQSIIELEQAIASKEEQAKADRKRLTEKKAAYEAEAGKWRKQVRVSERTYENFAGLKE